MPGPSAQTEWAISVITNIEPPISEAVVGTSAKIIHTHTGVSTVSSFGLDHPRSAIAE